MDKVLIIDDDPAVLTLLNTLLTSSGYEVIKAHNGEEGIRLTRKEHPDLIITDHGMPGISGLEVLVSLKKDYPELPMVMLTCYSDVSLTIKAIQAGVYDYLEKPIQPKRLLDIVSKGIQVARQGQSIKENVTGPLKKIIEDNILTGKSVKIRLAVKMIGRVSMSRMNVLITGEQGSGKEQVATLVHYSGITREFPFVLFRCDEYHEDQIDEALFGTAADQKNPGKNEAGALEKAGEGTLVLLEFQRLPLRIQSKIHRTNISREYSKTGSYIRTPFKARIIGTSCLSLESLLTSSQVLPELLFSLKLFHIDVPPLRQRSEDIPELLDFYLERLNRQLGTRVTKQEKGLINMLQGYHWPGNIQEFENMISQALVLAQTNVLERRHFQLVTSTIGPEDSPEHKLMSMDEMETNHVLLVLNAMKGNKQETARILGISRPTLNAKLKKAGYLK